MKLIINLVFIESHFAIDFNNNSRGALLFLSDSF